LGLQALSGPDGQPAVHRRRDGQCVCGEDSYVSLGDSIMKSVYFEDDDILQIRVSDKPIVREISQGWNTNISYAEDGSIVEIVLLDAKKEGLLPLEFKRAA
jgi:uncharacterized protein YuzE